MRVSAAQLRLLRPREVASPPAPGTSRNGAPEAAGGRARDRHGVQIAWIMAACLAIAAISLLWPSTPTYDPWAWILWGREITELDLVTEGGPSWKPLPILFTTPFALFGDDLAPYLWLWVARAGGLFGCVMAYRVANRLVGGAKPDICTSACAPTDSPDSLWPRMA